MRSGYQIVPAAREHIPYLADRMREADRREIWASHRHTPTEALTGALVASTRAWSALIGGRPEIMWGVAPAGSLLSRTGCPWLLASPALENQVGWEFRRWSRYYVERMQTGFDRLENCVAADNLISRRWLAWCGFTLADAVTVINGHDFIPFWREANQCVI